MTLRANQQQARSFKVCKRNFGLDHFWLNYDMGDIMRNARPRLAAAVMRSFEYSNQPRIARTRFSDAKAKAGRV